MVLEHHVNKNSPDWMHSPSPDDAFIAAFVAGDCPRLEAAIAAGAGVEVRLGDTTPLHCATLAGRVGIVQVLIDAGVPLDAHDVCKRTALHYAAMGIGEPGIQITGILLRAGANPNAQDEDQHTPLDWATHMRCKGTAALIRAAGGRNNRPFDRGYPGRY